MKQKRIKPNIDFSDFFSRVGDCAGEVYFITSAGNRINLKSFMSQIFFQTTFVHNVAAADGHVHCHKPADYALLGDFLE